MMCSDLGIDTQPDPTPPDASGRSPRRRFGRVRTFLAIALGVIGIMSLFASTVAVWAYRVAFDPERVAGAVEDALLDPEVTAALATYLADEVVRALPIEEILQDRAPRLAVVAPVLSGAVQSRLEDRFTKRLSEERVRNLLVEATERAQTALNRVLAGGKLIEGVTAEGDKVTVNLLPLVSLGLEELQDEGLLKRVDLPTFTRQGDPKEQIAELSDAIGHELPDDFGQLVVYEGAKVSKAQQVIARAQHALIVFRRTVAAVIAVSLLCLVASAVLATRRRRAVIALLLGAAAAMVLGHALVEKVVEEAPTLVLNPGARAAIGNITSDLTSGLLTALTVTALVALVLVAIGYLTGRRSTAAEEAKLSTAEDDSGRGIIHNHPDGVAIAAFTAAVMVIVLAGFSVGPIVLAAALTAIGIGVLVVGGGGRTRTA